MAVRFFQWIGRVGIIALLGALISAEAHSQTPNSPPATETPGSAGLPPLPELPTRRGEIIKPRIPAPSESRGRSLPDLRCGSLLESQRSVTPGCR